MLATLYILPIGRDGLGPNMLLGLTISARSEVDDDDLVTLFHSTMNINTIQ